MYAKRTLARSVIVLVMAILGCAGNDGPRRSVDPAGDGDTESVDEVYARRFALEGFEERLDAAKTFHASGNGFLFRTTRDSLVADVNAFIRANPHIERDGDFAGFFNRLSSLDTLDVDPTLPYEGYAAVEDSLALSFADWPELDMKLDPGLFSMSNTVFPTVENKRIDFWIRYFTGNGRSRFERAVKRMQFYRPTVEGILDEFDMPKELAVVALIESGYSMKAVSRARAVGPWQFIYGTAKLYRLRVNWWYDERRDIVASTYAACHYLKDLHAIWGDWSLALAAYNSGEYRVARQIARQRTENFWRLRLPRQTQRYVPKFLAALYILRDPGRYGIEVPEVEPFTYDEVVIKTATDLKVIARCAETTVSEIRKLNPQCRRSSTPPRMEVVIKVPPGRGPDCEASLAAIPANERITWSRHKVRKGDTLSMIARKYGTTVSAIKELNGIRNRHFIREGRYILVPARGAPAVAANTSRPRYKESGRSINKQALQRYAQKAAPPSGHKKVTYTVRDQDTLGEIAEVYKTSARKIRAWNGLSRRRYIYPGQKLAIYVPKSFRVPEQPVREILLPDETCCVKSTHVVRKGENFYMISKKYNVTVSELLAWNNRSHKSIVRPGERIHIWTRKSR